MTHLAHNYSNQCCALWLACNNDYAVLGTWYLHFRQNASTKILCRVSKTPPLCHVRIDGETLRLM